jgi:enoyl-[acyl-carrier-protein] reductase (NADH)
VDTSALTSIDIEVQSTLDYVRRRNPTRRLVTPHDVGRVAAFLCTDAAEMIIGQTLYVDGGFSLLTDYFPQLEDALQEEIMA